MSTSRKLAAEALGTALLLATVVGSGIMGERLVGGNAALALLANSIATGCMLATLILLFAPISGAHFNPAVTVAAASMKMISWRMAGAYILVQIAAAFSGVAAAHLMFGEPLFFASVKERTGMAQWWSEIVATFGLLTVIFGCLRSRPDALPFVVGLYITAAYWFTASTSFANPAVTLARAASNTFSGIRPDNVPAFIAAQAVGTVVAVMVVRWLLPPRSGGNN